MERVSLTLNELKANQKTGEGPRTLEEKRRLAREKELEEERRAKQEARDNITFKDYFDTCYYPNAQTSKKPGSALREKQHCQFWLNPAIGNIPIRQIKPLHLERVKKNLLSARKPRSPRTIQYVFATFRQVWNMARRDGYVEGDSPSKSVKTPRINNAKLRYLSHEEAGLLLNELEGRSKQLYDMALLSLHTGMRYGELCELTWKNVNIEQGFINVRDAKGKDRTVFLTDDTTTMLTRLKAGKDREPESFVFLDRNGNQIVQVSNAFDRAANGVKLNEGITDKRYRVTFHTLRHTFASWHAINGTDLYTLQKLMGHSTPLMTQRYAHLSNTALRDAARNFERALRKPEPQAEVIPLPA